MTNTYHNDFLHENDTITSKTIDITGKKGKSVSQEKKLWKRKPSTLKGAWVVYMYIYKQFSIMLIMMIINNIPILLHS